MMDVLTASASASFPPLPVSVRDARRFLRAFLSEHGAEALVDAAELALSEVVTNAVLHAHTDLDVSLALQPGGRLRVGWSDTTVLLSGPAVLVAEGTWGAPRPVRPAPAPPAAATTAGVG